MCGRFTLRAPTSRIADFFGITIPDLWQPRFNIAPTQWIPAIRCEGSSRQLINLHWGLIPAWAKEQRIGASMINARAETVAEKSAFRTAFRRRRCLIPGDGFYEWQKVDTKTKVPHLFEMSDESLRFCRAVGSLAVAGRPHDRIVFYYHDRSEFTGRGCA